MSAAGRRPAVVSGSAIRHANRLCEEAVPDASRMSCVGETIRIEVPEAEFLIRLARPSAATTRLRIQAVFRENRPAGGTWWSSWEVDVAALPGSAEVGRALVAELTHSRASFTAALADARWTEAA
ncbi:hypothetical protein [Streptomyces xanthochromogenes]|uniref:hypothetical protein n=1 Tax=Streptomyces xanthochromogenes TaxID=67384 RepID=UPI0016768FDB|nr:hypothetical protein [Streptomyces xanthochromogenes]